MSVAVPDWLRFGLPIALVGVLSVLGVVAVFFSGILPSRFVDSVGLSAGIVQALVGAVLFGLGLVYLRAPDSVDEANHGFVGEAPERPKRPPRIVGEQFDSSCEQAVRAVRLKDVDYETTDPHQLLSETAQEVLAVRGHEMAAIDQQLSTGEWTSDPVAAGFLGDDSGYPVWFRLLQWATPSYAYRLAVDRTTRAIQSLLDPSVSVSDSQRGWASEFRADVERYLSADVASDDAVSAVDTEPATETEASTETEPKTETEHAATPPEVRE